MPSEVINEWIKGIKPKRSYMNNLVILVTK